MTGISREWHDAKMQELELALGHAYDSLINASSLVDLVKDHFVYQEDWEAIQATIDDNVTSVQFMLDDVFDLNSADLDPSVFMDGEVE